MDTVMIAPSGGQEVEVLAKAKRRRFTVEYKRRMERERLRQLENTRAKELARQAEALEKAQQIRVYIQRAREAERVYLPEGLEIDSLKEWLDWARQHADRIDPFRTEETHQESIQTAVDLPIYET